MRGRRKHQLMTNPFHICHPSLFKVKFVLFWFYLLFAGWLVLRQLSLHCTYWWAAPCLVLCGSKAQTQGFVHSRQEMNPLSCIPSSHKTFFK